MVRIDTPDIKEAGIYICVFIFVFSIFFGSRYVRLYSSDAIVPGELNILLLEEAVNLDQLAAKLEDLEVNVDREELYWAASILGWRNFNAGRYELSGNYSYGDFLSKIARGLQDHVSVTVPPGIEIGRFSQLLASQLQADSVQFESIFRDSLTLEEKYELSSQAFFARMLPDTYNIYWTTRPERVIERIYTEFKQRVETRYSDQIRDSGFNLNEILTLASIVEWEASLHEEKPRISELYMNRLDRNMPLQADPTVNFAIGERRRLLYEDYRIEHPYNTYLISGLPPGPLTNPDLQSILAVLNPEEHDYIYMVANPDGGHVFSQTFEQHQIASAEWREWLQEQYRIRDEEERRSSEMNR